jgi:hypothetical protein
LGCSGSGAGGDGQVTCGIQDVFVNAELRVAFDEEVDPSSLSVFSFQVTELGSGKTPAADRFVDPNDPRVVIYRPKLSFDSSGNPVFGLDSEASYTVKLPGAVEDPGDVFVRSKGGGANQHRMLCTVEASLGVLDVKPGQPKVTVTVDQVTGYDPISGEPSTFALDVPAQGAVDVYRFSEITFVFDDLMNPASLVNPVTGESESIEVAVDPDGVLSDPSDQQVLEGTFSIFIDQEMVQTTVVFTPELGYPSAGSEETRRVVVQLPPTISDLGGNPLANAGNVVFTPEVVLFEPTALEEDFLTREQEDQVASGGDWGEKFPGILLPGVMGGSGRLGHLFLAAGETLTLNTDSEDFSEIASGLNFSPANVIDATFDGTSFTFPPVTDGIFEFASVRLNSGSQLRFEGSRPARVFVRGEVRNNGRISAAGGDLGEHSDKQVFGQTGGSGGPGGGKGGDGGRLPTWVGFASGTGVLVPEDPLINPPVLSELNGQLAQGVPDNLLNPTSTNLGIGTGGLAWPQPTATQPTLHLPNGELDISGMEFDVFGCKTIMKGGVGSGGAFALNGGNGINKPLLGLLASPPPDAMGGKASDFGLGIGSDPDSPARTLSPEDGWLHGGAGGAGGGSHVANSTTNGTLFINCYQTVLLVPAQIVTYFQVSSAGGGGGGGGLQIQAGRRLDLDGIVDVSGGQGGGKTLTGFATAGGGGAGGAALLQGPTVEIAAVPGRIDITGGPGGFGAGASIGGNGGTGLLRLETLPPLLNLSTEISKLLPNATTLTTLGATPDDVYSVGEYETATAGPGLLSGAQSCWIRPEGNFFLLEFEADDGDTLGWDLDFLPNPPSLGVQSYRGDNDLFGSSIESILGTELGAAPLVVRFQGARAVKQIDDLCDVDLGGDDSPIAPGSLTGWVEHPALLNGYFANPNLAPNMVRFQILFDRSNPFFGGLTGITGLTLSVRPN